MTNTELLCMRLTSMKRRHLRQDNSRRCSICAQHVGIFPSGQNVLRHDPKVKIVCDVCARQRSYDIAISSPGAIAEIGDTYVHDKDD